MYTRLSGRGLYPRFLSDNTASDLVSGVDQIAPSTPGVHLPWFSVTRFTAKALPLSEWMSKRCNAFALRRLPHDTDLQTPHSSMAVGPVGVPPIESRAGARVRPKTLLCAVLRRGIAVVLVKKDRAEVCPLSRGMMSALHLLNPYPPHYRPAFASSALSARIPISLPYGRPALTGDDTGLPRSA